MTEYGRSPGSEPWHPEDPLYGDQGWGGQQADAGQPPYGGQPQQQYPQQPQAQQYGGQQDPYQQQYDEQQRQYNQQQQQYAQQQYNQQQQQYNQQQYNGGWDTGQQAAMPYGANPGDPYGGRQPGYGDQNADYYATPEAYPPPQPPGRRRPEPEPHQQPESTPDWQAEAPEEENHPFFTGDDGRDDDDDEYDDDPSESRRGGGRERRGKTKKKSRNGCACLVVSLVLASGLGGVGYFGYQYWQGQFGEAEDFEGAGKGVTQVVIPKGAGLLEIGGILKKAGVVKSSGAFVAAANSNPKGKTIQEGVYSLNKSQSAAIAVTTMLDPASRNNLIIPEGKRNAFVYAQIDKRLEAKAGTAKAVAKAEVKNLGLPEWANDRPDVKDPLEGFLFPASYAVAKGDDPADVLKKMVARANSEYTKAGVESKATQLGLKDPWELLTLASLVQVEGKTHDDFRKMAEVVYNRLKPTNTETNQLLQFDSAFNYLKGQSKIDISEGEINSNQDPYNTYTQKGLTPGPISNPGNDALAAAVNPTKDGWLYFVATDGKSKTEFAKTHDEFLRLKAKFDARKD